MSTVGTTTAPRTGAVAAAHQAIVANATRVTLPWIGTVQLPAPQRLVWYGGVIVIAAFDLIDWPVAVVLAVGHALAEQHHNQLVHDFGEALEEV